MKIGLLLLAFAAVRLSALEKQLHVRVPMRDGITLCTHVFRPDGPGRFPAILLRTPYRKPSDISANYEWLVGRGYAVVIQDVRGRYDSAGLFSPLIQEGPDGEDTIAWIARQPWSDGGVGMMGGSYLGMAQWRVAALSQPNLKAICPVVAGWDDYLDRFYSRGGAFKLGHRLLWSSENLRAPDWKPKPFADFIRHLPLETSDFASTGRLLPSMRRAFDHPAYDSYWKELSIREKIDRVTASVFLVTGWYDNYAQGDLEAFAALRARKRDARIVVGPWPHDMSQRFPGVDYGADSSSPVGTLQVEWFDHWLKGLPLTPRAPAQIFVMGSNRWREFQEWPPLRSRLTPLYLSANSTLRDRAPRVAGESRFTFDPRSPVPTMGGSICCNPLIFPWGPMDQRPVEQRSDVLVFSGPELTRDVEIIGPIRVVLHVSTSAPDTDFTAKIVDVFPDGTARNLTDGILRLRYRDSLEKVSPPAKPSETYRISIDAGVTANTFLKGHKIRVEISSSNFPRFDRNPNTGGPVAKERELRVANQIVRYGGKTASHILLPVMR